MKNPTWRIITLGYLYNHNVWDYDPPGKRHACTTTFIESGNRRILVDPGNHSPFSLEEALVCRTSLKPEDIDTVFLTHFHKNHFSALHQFKKSVWLMARTEIQWWSRQSKTSEEEKNILSRIIPIEEHSIPGVEPISTPGHTHGLTSLLFETREGMVVIAGDAILTFEHFDSREPSENSEDIKEARRSIDRIAKIADLIVPGHDNYFVV